MQTTLMTGETIPVWFRRALVVLGAILALLWLAHFGLAMWAQNETAPAESIVALQSMMLARDGGLYYANQDYPYTITAYTPIFYWLEAGLHRLGIPVLMAGRLISFAASLGTLLAIWGIVFLYTRSRASAFVSLLLCAGSCSMQGWSIVGRVDPLALFFAFAAFYQYARFAVDGSPNLRWAGLLAVAAVMTKQTMVACPTAIFLLLWMQNKGVALRFAGAVGGACVAIVGAADLALHGRFMFNTVFANINPFALEKLAQHGEFIAIAAGQLVLVVALGAWKAARGAAKGPFLYLGFAIAVLIATAAKIGSDTNYHLETTILLSICCGLSLHSLSFFPSVFQGSKAWVTLLQVPLLVHLVNNARIAVPFLATRVAIEQQMAAQGAKLRRHLDHGTYGAPVVSMDFNVLLHTRGRLDVEPLIYNLLVRAGRIDPEPLRRDLASARVPVVLLHEDAANPSPADPEIPTLPESQLAEIRKNYELVEQIEGPYFGGIRVYKPKRQHAAAVHQKESLQQ